MLQKKNITCIAISISACFLLWSCDTTSQFDVDSTNDRPVDTMTKNFAEAIPEQWIVVLKDPESPEDSPEQVVESVRNQIASLLADNNIGEADVLYQYTYSVKGFAVKLSQSEADDLSKDERIKYIEQDQKISIPQPVTSGLNDLLFEDHKPQETPYGISRVGGPFDGSGSTAWVIDTGVDLDHADLNVNTEKSTSFVLTEPTADDKNGHGTHVAGTIGALDNDIDVVGVAAGAQIVAVKVLNALGIGNNSDVIAGVDYVAEHASANSAANLSLGGSPSEALDEAIRNAADRDVLFAIAAGNDGEDANNYSPARVEYNNVWTTSAVDSADVFASFSNWSGPTEPPIEFAAPGVDIESLWINNGTNTISGTSMASPHVAGVLLVSGGNPESDGSASNDPDGDPDPIVSN